MMTLAPRSLAGLAGLGIAALMLPLALSDYNLRVMVLALQTAIAVIGLCIAFGWAGLIQLAQASFVGIGAYTAALVSLKYGLGFWLVTPLAMLVSGLVALVIAGPMLRLRGHYLALATVGLSVTTDIVAKNWVALTNGFDGISGIPGVFLGGYELTSDREYYYLSLVFVVLVALFAIALRHSAYGRAMIAVRDNELASGTASVPVVRIKILAFVLASMLAGLSGSLFAHYSHYIAPQDFELVHSVTILVMLIVGGEISVIGAVLGAILLSFAPELLRFVGQAYLAIFGAGVLIVLILMPDGIVGQFERLRARLANGGKRHA
jgi:branched-chain amino acid transport system permease protein